MNSTKENQAINYKLPRDILIIATLMMLFGLAEVKTGFSHEFFGLTTTQASLSTYLGVTIGLFYFFGGLFILFGRKWAAALAIILLVGDIIGRIFMVLDGLFPLTSFLQTFSIIAGTAIAAFFAVYIGLKWKSFR